MDGQNRGIASADTLWTPLGASVPVNRGTAPELMMFAGRKYLVRTFSAMLQGRLGAKARLNALFVHLQRPAGSRLEINPALRALPNGRRAPRIVLHCGQHAIMGCSDSSG